MRLLLDTHIALWLALDKALLRAGERALLDAEDAELSFSAVSIWELRLKWDSLHASGDRKGPAHPRQVLETLIDGGVPVLALTADHAAADLFHPLSHKDPFDELLLIQAQEEGMRLLTRDAKLAGHSLAIVG